MTLSRLNDQGQLNFDGVLAQHPIPPCVGHAIESEKIENGDVVVRPSHYTRYDIEPITFIMRNKLPFWMGNIIKYVCRSGGKRYDGMTDMESEITDLKKARRYIEIRINQLENNEIL